MNTTEVDGLYYLARTPINWEIEFCLLAGPNHLDRLLRVDLGPYGETRSGAWARKDMSRVCAVPTFAENW